jgi:hypothetical protein
MFPQTFNQSLFIKLPILIMLLILFSFNQATIFLYKYSSCLCFNKSVLNWTFCQSCCSRKKLILHYLKMEVIDDLPLYKSDWTNLKFLVQSLEVGVFLDGTFRVSLEVGQPRLEAQIFGLQFLHLVLQLLHFSSELVAFDLEKMKLKLRKCCFW